MLVISRKPGEEIQIGDNVKIMIVRIANGTVRIGIEAPRDMNIVRDNAATDADGKPRKNIKKGSE